MLYCELYWRDGITGEFVNTGITGNYRDNNTDEEIVTKLLRSADYKPGAYLIEAPVFFKHKPNVGYYCSTAYDMTYVVSNASNEAPELSLLEAIKSIDFTYNVLFVKTDTSDSKYYNRRDPESRMYKRYEVRMFKIDLKQIKHREKRANTTTHRVTKEELEFKKAQNIANQFQEMYTQQYGYDTTFQ